MSEDKRKLKIVFFGTPEFAVASLDRLLKKGCDIAAVVTMPDKQAGRGHKIINSDIKKYALEHSLPILQPENLKDQEFIERLRNINADLFIVIAFRMLPEIVWSMPPLGTFNLHASLLPKYRGAAPINWAVINGEKETGVTTFFLKHEIDTGDIISQRKIEILPEYNVGDVHDILMEIGAEEVEKVVDDIEKGVVKSLPQPDGEYVAAPKIHKETCHIRWEEEAEKINNLIRGLSPYPGAWTTLSEDKDPDHPFDVKIYTSKPYASIDESLSPGEISVDGDKMFVGTGKGALEVISLQPAGKKRMDTSAFLRGYRPIKFI